MMYYDLRFTSIGSYGILNKYQPLNLFHSICVNKGGSRNQEAVKIDYPTVIGKKKVADSIIEDFKSKLQNGTLKEGDKLPNQNEYARQLGVSRLSLREALQTLQAMGAVSQRPKVGTIITCADPQKWIRIMPGQLLNDAKSVNELLEARSLIESAVITKYAAFIDKSDLNKMQELVSQQREAFISHQLERFCKCDTDFHLQIVLSTKNRFLYRMYMEIFQMTQEFIIESFREIPQTIADAMQMHESIYAALAKRDSKAATSLMQEHIRLIQKHCQNYYESKENPEISAKR